MASRKGANALKKITHRAKVLMKGGGYSWKSAIKKASAEYRSGKPLRLTGKSGKRFHQRRKSTRVVHRLKRKISGMPKRKSKRRRATIQKIKRLHRAEGRAMRSLNGIPALKTKLKKKLEGKLADGLLRQYKATTKRHKRKIAKSLLVVKRDLRSLQRK